ncbi:MAG TPA: pitrilysin family protein [Bacilli bacterium]
MIKHKLTNGLRVVMERMPACRSVSFGIWVKIGSRNEDEQNNGISHLIEHMLFKGTDKYSAKEIAEIFDGIGGNVNAFTSREYTCYYAKVLDSHLPIALDVLSNMFFHSRIDPADLLKEKNVVLEEISMYDDTPDDLVHDAISRAAYGGHPLGYSILGTAGNLAEMQSADLLEYMQSHYSICNTVISIAGNIEDNVIELIEQYFGRFANQGIVHSDTLQIPLFQGEQVFHKKKTEQNHICMSIPGCSMLDANLYPMILLNNAIGGGMSSRLFQEIREKRGLAYSIYSYHSAHMDSGLFTIYTGTAPKQTEEVLRITMGVLEDVAANGLSEAELRKGKEQLKGSLILGLESTSSRMNRLGKNELMLGYHYTLDEIIDKIEFVTMDQIERLTRQLFSVPFALAMVGQTNRVISKFRRDQLVLQRPN